MASPIVNINYHRSMKNCQIIDINDKTFSINYLKTNYEMTVPIVIKCKGDPLVCY